MKPFTRETITHKTNQTVADRYIRNFSRLGQDMLPTQNALPKYFGIYCFKETERSVLARKKETDMGFQEAEVGVYCLAYLFFAV